MFQDKPFLAAFRLCCTVPFCLLCLDALLLGGRGQPGPAAGGCHWGSWLFRVLQCLNPEDSFLTSLL